MVLEALVTLFNGNRILGSVFYIWHCRLAIKQFMNQYVCRLLVELPASLLVKCRFIEVSFCSLMHKVYPIIGISTWYSFKQRVEFPILINFEDVTFIMPCKLRH